MTALRRMEVRIIGGLIALVALGLSSAAYSQDSDAPVDVTAAPPPSAETVGPSQLRDFSLEGTVTRPSDGPAAATTGPATTAPAAPGPDEPVSSEAAAPAGGDRPVAPPALTSTAPAQPDSERRTAATPEPAAPPQPLEVITRSAPQPGFSSGDAPVGADLDSTGSPFSWPWLTALLALLAGGGFIAYSRRNRRQRYGDPGRMAFAGAPAPDAPEPRSLPPVRPRADPVPSRGGAAPARRPGPVPPPASRPAAAPKPVDDGLVVSTRFKPELNVHFVPDRVVVTQTDAVLQFDVVIANTGSAPARDVLVEARMFTAHPGQDQEIAAFFHQPAGAGDRIPGIAPLGKLSLKSAVRLPLDQLRSFEAAGRRLFVPLIGFNILFRSSNGEDQASASFLVGRGGKEDEKLAPFRLDLGPRIFLGLSARPHSLGLQPA